MDEGAAGGDAGGEGGDGVVEEGEEGEVGEAAEEEREGPAEVGAGEVDGDDGAGGAVAPDARPAAGGGVAVVPGGEGGVLVGEGELGAVEVEAFLVEGQRRRSRGAGEQEEEEGQEGQKHCVYAVLVFFFFPLPSLQALPFLFPSILCPLFLALCKLLFLSLLSLFSGFPPIKYQSTRPPLSIPCSGFSASPLPLSLFMHL